MQYNRHVGAILLCASKPATWKITCGAANIALTAEELTELDAFTAPSPLYLNWFQTFATDAAVRDAVDANKICEQTFLR